MARAADCSALLPGAPAGIRLAGATNDVHVFDVRTGTWCKISPQGEPPSPRAAHAAAAVGAMVVVQVGASCVQPGCYCSATVRTCCHGLATVGFESASELQADAQHVLALACVCRAASALPAWRQRTCTCWTLQTWSGRGGTGAFVCRTDSSSNGGPTIPPARAAPSRGLPSLLVCCHSAGCWCRAQAPARATRTPSAWWPTASWWRWAATTASQRWATRGRSTRARSPISGARSQTQATCRAHGAVAGGGAVAAATRRGMAAPARVRVRLRGLTAAPLARRLLLLLAMLQDVRHCCSSLGRPAAAVWRP